jgi:hypothetical protein
MVMDKKLVKSVAEQAAAAVSDIADDELRKAAYSLVFNRVLDEELAAAAGTAAKVSRAVPAPVPVYREAPSGTQEGKGFDKMMSAQFDWSRYEFIHKLEPYTQYLLVLRIGLEEFGVDGLTPPEIKEILSEKFRILKVYNTISMALAGVRGKYVDRVRQGNGYAYKISKAGLDKIDNSVAALRARGEIV